MRPEAKPRPLASAEEEACCATGTLTTARLAARCSAALQPAGGSATGGLGLNRRHFLRGTRSGGAVATLHSNRPRATPPSLYWALAVNGRVCLGSALQSKERQLSRRCGVQSVPASADGPPPSGQRKRRATLRKTFRCRVAIALTRLSRRAVSSPEGAGPAGVWAPGGCGLQRPEQSCPTSFRNRMV